MKETELTITEDLRPILNLLSEEDAKSILVLKEELADNWRKKQIFRTETEMRVSVLNDGKHPTQASKYWQSVREQNSMFESLIHLSFDIRRNDISRLKLSRKIEKSIAEGKDLKKMELQVDLDENLFSKASMEQVAKDRVRELNMWSTIKQELNDGTFDDKNVNSHQSDSLQLYFINRVKSLGPNSESAEVMNAVGPLQTLERLKTKEGKLLNFKESKNLIESKK